MTSRKDVISYFHLGSKSDLALTKVVLVSSSHNVDYEEKEDECTTLDATFSAAPEAYSHMSIHPKSETLA